jgi:hypothetical protein
MTTSRRLWTSAVLAVSAPIVTVLIVTLWRAPVPVTETVALLEDVTERPVVREFNPATAYYRPLFHTALATIWRSGATLETKLAAIKLLTIVPVLLLVLALIAFLRPSTGLEAVAAALALAVLLGSGGFRDNLEIGLNYTIVGMALALLVWILLNRERRAWSTPAVAALTLLAIGFKEQGLVLVPVVLVAWWTRAPGTSRSMAAVIGSIGILYVALRLSTRSVWATFEQDVGFGFTELDRFAAAARFGDFPYWIYAYNGMSTVSNVLFAEPTRGVFRIVHAFTQREIEPWHVIHLGSSAALTALIVWWGVRSLKRVRGHDWPDEARLFLAMLVALFASGALSFNYSRDRLGGMAVVFYALASSLAVRAAAERLTAASRARFAAAALGLMLIIGAWHVRAFATLERVRFLSESTQADWLVQVPERRLRLGHRPVYLRIMDSMTPQGIDPAAPGPTRFPMWVRHIVGP